MRQEPLNRRVLVVEDDHAYETILKRIVRAIDPAIRIDWVSSAEKALQRIGEVYSRGETYDLIVADIFLSGEKTGLDFWEICQKHMPNTPVVITSGLPANKFLSAVGQRNIAPPFLEKPFTAGECRQILEGFLNHA
jgi:DNA-binding NtrC family response regulator